MSSSRKKRKLEAKVYIVMQKNNLTINNCRDNFICAKLNRASAERIVDRTPGAYIWKITANKE